MESQTKNKKDFLISWKDKESERDGSKTSIMGKIYSYAFKDDSLEVIQDSFIVSFQTDGIQVPLSQLGFAQRVVFLSHQKTSEKNCCLCTACTLTTRPPPTQYLSLPHRSHGLPVHVICWLFLRVLLFSRIYARRAPPPRVIEKSRSCFFFFIPPRRQMRITIKSPYIYRWLRYSLRKRL